ncbi:General stress protein CTC [Polystyrenella longa]|uniref:Large ribosomal subunit protein bL25 n=1 Tax=Polystyrenella longa TaxID=2528007 RepID=A0A518CKF9_9PLAN|nr:50S ribosomal protein L25 [Polystyrenella longa]QDU79715.1 General stress protein CTC [Polystyrenella longa]
MTSAINLDVEKRSEIGSRASRKLRAQNLVPGIVFGHKQDSVPVTVKREDIDSILQSHDKVVDLQLDGKTETAVITQLHWDTFGVNINHVDFQRVDPNERVQVEINIVLKGLAHGVTEGGSLEQMHRRLSIECPAISIPHELVVRISDMNIGDELTVGDLKLPENVTLLEDASIMVAHVIKPTVEDLTEEEDEDAPTEPELAGKSSDKDEE